jgi:type II secretory pathway pseudopilin PulG
MGRSWKRRLTWLAVGIATVLALYVPISAAQRATVESGQRSLIAQAERQLAAHYAVHGRYPDSLKGMNFVFSDGADAHTLERLKYSTDGQYYRIVTTSDFDGKEISACR